MKYRFSCVSERKNPLALLSAFQIFGFSILVLSVANALILMLRGEPPAWFGAFNISTGILVISLIVLRLTLPKRWFSPLVDRGILEFNSQKIIHQGQEILLSSKKITLLYGGLFSAAKLAKMGTSPSISELLVDEQSFLFLVSSAEEEENLHMILTFWYENGFHLQEFERTEERARLVKLRKIGFSGFTFN